jgi:hypothetical protein
MSARAVAIAALLALAAFSLPAAAEEGPRWQDLSISQRSALKPLEREWGGIDAARKQKWLDIAGRYHGLPPAEQARMSARMTQWATLSPNERGKARLNFQDARQLTPQERQSRWEAYQALTPEQRRQLAARQVPPAREKAARDPVQTKSNIVPNPAFAAPPRPVAPTVMQAAPGATTSLINKRPVPPAHQQPGLPKIAATPGFVDKSTLLPQRGPQGAATRPAEAASPPRRGAR